jgi:phosphoribosylaminoimidazolecarboxamide formyltransferase/IMP cyclohydrolase
MKQRALISVYDKTGIVEFAVELNARGVELVASDKTALLLKEHGLPVTSVSQLTGYPELLDGRVKTLHPAIHAAILARREHASDMVSLKEQSIEPFDYVVVNLYPFEQAFHEGQSGEALLSMIDVGGVALLRAAAKNHPNVLVVPQPSDYEAALDDANRNSLAYRRKQAAKAFVITSAYDALIAHALRQGDGELFPEVLTLAFTRADTPRYGENPHQAAAVYHSNLSASSWLTEAKKHSGKTLSYNNIRDAQAAWTLASRFDRPSVVIVKHQNPCGVGSADTIFEAWRRAFEADSVSAFGGVVALNGIVDLATVTSMRDLFIELVIAQGFEADALSMLMQKKNLRLLSLAKQPSVDRLEFVSVDGGLLIQETDDGLTDLSTLPCPTKRQLTSDQIRDCRFAMKVAAVVKSNAIVLAKDETTVGIGAGQMNRVKAAAIALAQAGEAAGGSVMASDGFLPMTDTVELAHRHGVGVIVQPGGSVADNDVLRLCDQYDIALWLTKKRHFKH